MALEEGLRVRTAEAQLAAAKAGATGASVVQALELEARQLGTPATTNQGRGATTTDDAIPQDAFELACRSPTFRSIEVAFRQCDLSTAQGRLDALGSGFDGRCPLILRSVMEGSETLAKRHWLLEAFRELKPFTSEYMKYVLTVDPASGTVPLHLLHTFTLTQPDGSPAPLLENLLKFRVRDANWVDPPYGMLGLMAAQDQAESLSIDQKNHYCQPEILDDLGPFMHKVFVGLGAASTSSKGFTMATWVARYAKHVRRALSLANDAEKLTWLRRAVAWFLASLELVSVLWKSAVRSSTPGSTQWEFVLPFDCEMAKGMDDTELHLLEMLKHRTYYDWMKPEGRASNRYRLPLLASHTPKKRPSGDARGGDASRGTSDEPVDLGTTLEDDGLGRGGDDKKPEPTAPGALTNTWAYLASPHDKLLLMSKTVWDTEAEAKHYKVPWGSKCWPLINSGRAEAKLMGQCPCSTKSGHRSLKDASHVLKGFDRAHAFETFTRAATAEEIALLPPHEQAPQSGKRRKKGKNFRQPPRA